MSVQDRGASASGALVPVVMVDEFKMWLPTQPRPFHKGSSHLTVDGDSDEHIAALHELAKKIGLRRSWYQSKSGVPPLRAGAVFVPAKEQARRRIAARVAKESEVEL